MIAALETRCPYFRARLVNDIMIVHLSDSVDAMNFVELLQHLRDFTTGHTPPISAVLLNFSHVGFLQSTAWNRVVDFAVSCEQSGMSVSACHVPSVFRSLASDQSIVNVYADEESAMTAQNESTPVEQPTNTNVAAESPADTESVREAPPSGYLSAMMGLFILWPKTSLLTLAGTVAAIALIFIAGPSEFTRQHQLCERLAAGANALKERNASASEWAEFLRRSQVELTPIIQNLSSQGNARTESQTELLSLARDLLKIIDSPKDEDDWESQIKDVQTRLQQLKQDLNDA